jgi:hypothetical protein
MGIVFGNLDSIKTSLLYMPLFVAALSQSASGSLIILQQQYGTSHIVCDQFEKIEPFNG